MVAFELLFAGYELLTGFPELFHAEYNNRVLWNTLFCSECSEYKIVRSDDKKRSAFTVLSENVVILSMVKYEKLRVC